MLLVASQMFTIALLGGVLGVVLWLGGILVTNSLATAYLTQLPIARTYPLLAVYGLAVAIIVGILSLPYLLVTSRRTTDIRELEE